MKLKQIAFLLVVLSAGTARAYDGTVHTGVTDQAMTFFSNNKAGASGFLSTTVNGKTYRDIILDAACEPDREGKELTNDEIQKNSDLKNYNFEASVSKNINAAVKVMFGGVYPFVAIGLGVPLKSSIFGVSSFDSAVETSMKAVVTQKASGSLGELKRATQHTYVKGEGMFGDTFNDISIAPYAAQADYNLAVKAWKAGDKAEAIRRLGRVLHYVQDITVPHHISLDINIPDVSRAAVEFVKVGPANIMNNSSQVRYERDTAQTYLANSFNQSVLQGFVSQLQNNNNIGRSIPDVLINIRSQVQNTGLMGTVDGYSNGGLAKRTSLLSWAKKLWDQIKQKATAFTSEVVAELNKFKNALVQGVRNTAGDQLKQVVEQHLNSTYKYKSVNDDFAGTAAKLVPIAIVESAKILDRFVVDVSAGSNSSSNSCAGASNGWQACRGSGCSVCAEKVDTQKYDLYFKNHSSCTLNNTCGGRFYNCSLNCPAPTEADSSAGSSASWQACRGSGVYVCTEKSSGYSKYFQNHPQCQPNTTCQGKFYQCSPACPAPTESDR